MTAVCASVTVATASHSSAAVVTVSAMVGVSPWSAPCTVTPTIALVSMSTAYSALCARWVRPSFIFVMRALGACAIEARQIRARRRLDARGLRESRQKLLIRLAGVAAHDTPQGGVRFKGRGIDPDGRALHEVGGRQHLQDPGEHRPVRLQIDQAPRPRDRRVLGRRLLEAKAQTPAERERIGGAPRDAALRVDALEYPISSSRKYVPGVRLGRPTVAA